MLLGGGELSRGLLDSDESESDLVSDSVSQGKSRQATQAAMAPANKKLDFSIKETLDERWREKE
jgi:hypothetical protein